MNMIESVKSENMVSKADLMKQMNQNIDVIAKMGKPKIMKSQQADL